MKFIQSVMRKSKSPFSIDVKVGDTMQWKADLNSRLVVYEVCYPPYADGRYENLPEKEEKASK